MFALRMTWTTITKSLCLTFDMMCQVRIKITNGAHTSQSGDTTKLALSCHRQTLKAAVKHHQIDFLVLHKQCLLLTYIIYQVSRGGETREPMTTGALMSFVRELNLYGVLCIYSIANWVEMGILCIYSTADRIEVVTCLK